MTKVRKHVESEHPHKEAGQKTMLIRQLSKAAPCGNVNCVLCDKQLEVRFAFRCYYCGFFVCPSCGPKHFGQTRDEYFDDEHSA
jgi:hypothetical protein